jgi:hypothetical protein
LRIGHGEPVLTVKNSYQHDVNQKGPAMFRGQNDN